MSVIVKAPGFDPWAFFLAGSWSGEGGEPGVGAAEVPVLCSERAGDSVGGDSEVVGGCGGDIKATEEGFGIGTFAGYEEEISVLEGVFELAALGTDFPALEAVGE